jgi:Mn-dependent DtxR family transcriptional regulator
MESFDDNFIRCFLRHLQGHYKHNPVKSAELEAAFNMTGSQVRDLVRRLRRQGYWIASGSTGYWIARTRIEYEDSMRHLRSRAMSLLMTLRDMKISLNRVTTEAKQRELWEQHMEVR